MNWTKEQLSDMIFDTEMDINQLQGMLKCAIFMSDKEKEETEREIQELMCYVQLYKQELLDLQNSEE